MILQQKPQQALKLFLSDYNEVIHRIDEAKTFNKIKELIKYYSRTKSQILPNPLQHLEDKWYNSLQTEPDYSIYSSNDYFMEVWACWAKYSRNYLRLIANPKYNIQYESINTIADLGNGLGLSTAAFTEIYPNSKVYGTNIKESEQYKFCEFLQTKYDFELTDNLDSIGAVDMCFASEYFEHFQEPIAHLTEVLEKLNPRYLIAANSFNTIGIGHFKEYIYNGSMPGDKIGKIFIKTVKDAGYIKINPGYFNTTPSVYQRIK